ncbi:MAG: YceI family protein [Pseudomonadales bacterium]|nr:YceI family protein [Pseudomonadales bacterium]
MNLKKMTFRAVVLLLAMNSTAALAAAEDYIIDTKGAHAFIQFKIKHLGYSWLYGRFDTFSGTMKIDEKNPENSSIEITVDTASLNSNHAERDKHLRGEDFLNVKKYPTSTFKSTSVKKTGEGTGLLTGELTLHGVTKSIEVPISYVGGGKDPWGGYRHGFTGSTTLKLKDYGIDYNLGPASTEVELLLDIEAIKL